MGPFGCTVTGADDNSMSVMTNKLLTWVKHSVTNPVSRQPLWFITK